MKTKFWLNSIATLVILITIFASNQALPSVEAAHNQQGVSYDRDAAVAWANSNNYNDGQSHASEGRYCTTYVTRSMRAGGIDVPVYNGNGSLAAWLRSHPTYWEIKPKEQLEKGDILFLSHSPIPDDLNVGYIDHSVLITGSGIYSQWNVSRINKPFSWFAGAWEYEKGVHIITDQAPPSSTAILSGTIGENNWYISPVTVTLSASDDSSGVSYIQYSLNSSGWISYSAPFTVYQNGSNVIEYRAVDNAGNWEPTKSISFQIDNIVPSNPTTIVPGCVIQSGVWQNTCNDLSFFWSGWSDNASGVAGFQYYWGTSPTGTSTNWLAVNFYDPAAVNNGTYYFRIRTKDNAGNWSYWQTLFILKYDNELPTGTISLNQGAEITYTTLVKASLSGSDSYSGVTHYRLSDDGSVWTDWTPLRSSAFWLLPASDSQHTVYAQYKDQAGNVSGSSTVDIQLDLYPDNPSSSNYALTRSTFGVTGTTSDTTNYQLNGTLGQPSMVGVSTSTSYRVCAGYWKEIQIQALENRIFIPVILR